MRNSRRVRPAQSLRSTSQEYKYTRRQISSGNTPTHPTSAALFSDPQKLSSSRNMKDDRRNTHESKDHQLEGEPPHEQEGKKLGDFKHPTSLNNCDIRPPEEIAHYSCYPLPIDNTDEYRNEYQWDKSALRKYKQPELGLSFGDKDTPYAAPKMHYQSLACMITACIECGGESSLQKADIITRTSVLVRYAHLSNLRLVLTRFQFRYRRRYEIHRDVRGRKSIHREEIHREGRYREDRY